MTGKKVRRLLSLALSVVMIMTMMPVSALAADHTSDANDAIKIELMASTSFGHDYSKDGGGPKITNKNGYNNNAYTLLTAKSSNWATAGEPQKVAEHVQKVYEGTAGTLDNIPTSPATGTQTTVYVGIKLSTVKPTVTHGIASAKMVLLYDSSKLTPPANGNTSIVNLMSSGNTGDYDTSSQLLHDGYFSDQYSIEIGSSATATTEQIAEYGNNTNLRCLPVTLECSDSAVYALGENLDWHVVIPFTVVRGAKGTTVIEPVAKSGQLPAMGVILEQRTQAEMEALAETGPYLGKQTGYKQIMPTDQTVADHYITKGVTLNIVGPTLPPAISGITYDSGKAKIAFTNDADHAAVTDLKYQVAGTDTWTAIPSGDVATNVWTPADALQNELIAGKTITVSSDDGKATANSVAIGVSATGTGKVNQNTVPTGTVIIFNYAAKTAVPTTANASAVEVRVGTSGAWGASASIQDTKTQVYYRAKGDTNGIPSDGSKTYRTSTAAATNLTVATTTDDWSKKINGQTTLGAPAGGATYKYNVGSAANADTGTAFSAATDVSATTAQTIYLYRAPTDGNAGTGTDGTPAATGSVKGVGFVAPTAISVTTPTTPNATIDVTFTTDGQFQGASPYGITVNDGTSDLTGLTFTAKSSTGKSNDKVTISGITWDPAKTYSVKVAQASVKPQPAGDLTKTGIKLSQNGYEIDPKTITISGGTKNITVSPDGVIAPGGTATVTVNGLEDNESLNTITPSTGTATKTGANTFTYTAPAEVPTGVTKVTFSATITASNIQAKAVVATKTYNGDTTGTVSSITKADGTAITTTAADLAGVTATFKTADVGANKDVDIGGTLTVTVDGKTYDIANTAKGEIAAATAGAISAEVSNIRENAGIDALIAAILAAPVKVANSDSTKPAFPDQGTVADYVTGADDAAKKTAVETLLKTATIGGTPIYTAAAPKAEVTFAADTTETGVTIDANSVAGSTWTFPADTTFVKDDGTELTADELAALGFTADGTKLTLGSEAIAAAGSFSAKIGDSKSIAFTVGQITPKEEVAEESWKLVPGDLTVTIEDVTLSNFTGTGDKDIPVKVTIKKKGASGGVLYNTNGYATVADEEVEVDESGKITKLTAVTDVVKGASFVGWSTDGTKAHIVKEGATLGEDQEELIAVFDGYMSGMDATTMAPTKKVTRAQLLKMVLEASGQFDYNHDYGKPTKFKDSVNHWAARWIACAEQLGDKSPISGYEDGTFRPDRQVTREEAAIIIARAFGVEVKKGGTTDKVSDFDKVSDWAKDYVAALCDNGTINGLDDGTFGGKRGTQRDAASTMVNKYLGLTEAEKKAIAESAEIQNPYKDVGKGNWAYADLMFASLKVPSSYYQTEITMPTATPATPAE